MAKSIQRIEAKPSNEASRRYMPGERNLVGFLMQQWGKEVDWIQRDQLPVRAVATTIISNCNRKFRICLLIGVILPSTAAAQSPYWALSHSYLASGDRLGLRQALYLAAADAASKSMPDAVSDFRTLGQLAASVKTGDDLEAFMLNPLTRKYQIAAALPPLPPWQPPGVIGDVDTQVSNALRASTFKMLPSSSLPSLISNSSISVAEKSALDAVASGITGLSSIDKFDDFKKLVAQQENSLGNSIDPVAKVLSNFNADVTPDALLSAIQTETKSELDDAVSNAVSNLEATPAGNSIKLVQDVGSLMDGGLDGFEGLRSSAGAIEALGVLTGKPEVAADIGQYVSTGQQLYTAVALLGEASSGVGAFSAAMEIFGGAKSLGIGGSASDPGSLQILAELRSLRAFEASNFAAINSKLDSINNELDNIQGSIDALKTGQSKLLQKVDGVSIQLSDIQQALETNLQQLMSVLLETSPDHCLDDIRGLNKAILTEPFLNSCIQSFHDLAVRSGDDGLLAPSGKTDDLLLQFSGMASSADGNFIVPGNRLILAEAMAGIVANLNLDRGSSLSNNFILTKAAEGFTAGLNIYKEWYGAVPAEAGTVQVFQGYADEIQKLLQSSVQTQNDVIRAIKANLASGGSTPTPPVNSDLKQDLFLKSINANAKLPSLLAKSTLGGRGYNLSLGLLCYGYVVYGPCNSGIIGGIRNFRGSPGAFGGGLGGGFAIQGEGGNIPPLFLKYATAAENVARDLNRIAFDIMDGGFNGVFVQSPADTWLSYSLRECTAPPPIQGIIIDPAIFARKIAVDGSTFTGLVAAYKTAGSNPFPELSAQDKFHMPAFTLCAIDNSQYTVWDNSHSTGFGTVSDYALDASLNVTLRLMYGHDIVSEITRSGYQDNKLVDGYGSKVVIKSLFDFAKDGDKTIQWLLNKDFINAANSDSAVRNIQRDYFLSTQSRVWTFLDQQLPGLLNGNSVLVTSWSTPDLIAADQALQSHFKELNRQKAILISMLSIAFPTTVQDDDHIVKFLFGPDGVSLLDQRGVLQLAACDEMQRVKERAISKQCKDINSTDDLDLSVIHRSAVAIQSITQQITKYISSPINFTYGDTEWALRRAAWITGAKLPESFTSANGDIFENDNGRWTERVVNSACCKFVFKEVARTPGFVELDDNSRSMRLRLPSPSGIATWRSYSGTTWNSWGGVVRDQSVY